MGDIGKPRRRVIRVPATPIRKPAQEPSPAPKPAPEPVREPTRTGYAHDEPGARNLGPFATQVAIGALGGAGGNILSDQVMAERFEPSTGPWPESGKRL